MKSLLRVSCFFLLLGASSAFVSISRIGYHGGARARTRSMALKAKLPSAEESAKALTDYMAKAHEEKIRVMESVEAKFKDRIKELEDKIEKLEGPAPVEGGVKTESNSYLLPATNKDLLNKVQAYKDFLSDYTVKVQKEKVQAVAAAEQKVKEKYEAIIAELKKES